jgi:hypothetical protein
LSDFPFTEGEELHFSPFFAGSRIDRVIDEKEKDHPL